MLALHFFLAHTIADYSFSNPMKMYGTKSIASTLKHLLWYILVFLAFSFDTVFSSALGISFFVGSVALHFLIDYFRYSNKKPWWVESLSWISFFVVGVLSSTLFSNSYISAVFAMYLTGMVLVSVIPTQLFRMLRWIDPMENESDGISERLAIFIFLVAQNWLFTLISIGCGILYRLIFRKKFDRIWWLSPTIGVTVAFLFRWIMY